MQTHRHDQVGEHRHDLRGSSRKPLLVALAIIGVLAIIEATAGFLTNSLALLADAGHLLADAAAILLALLAIWIASRPFSMDRSYGYHRVEMFAALLNGMGLWAVAAYIGYNSYKRMTDPPEVDSLAMVLVASGGFIAQAITAYIVRRSTGKSLNVRAVYIHVMTDAVQSLGVAAAGLFMLAFGWFLADPIISILIALLITWSGWRITREAAAILMESSPSHVNVDALCGRLEQVAGVTGVHDIHAWSITSGYEVLSAHVTADMTVVEDREHLLLHLREIASREFGITHVTIQLEESPEGCEETHHIDHVREEAMLKGGRRRQP